MRTQTASSSPPRPSSAIPAFHIRLLLLWMGAAVLLSACDIRDAVRISPTPSASGSELRPGQFAVCVKAAAGATFDQERARAALGSVYGPIATERRWTHPTVWGRPPIIDFNCPAEPVLLQPGVTVSKGRSNSVRIVGNELLDPWDGRYIRYYFVLPKAEIDRLFFGDSYVPGHRNQVQEVLCGKAIETPLGAPIETWPREVMKPSCAALAIGTYLTADEIEDSRTMTPAVRYLHGLPR